MAKDGQPRTKRQRRRSDTTSDAGSSPDDPPPSQIAEAIIVIENRSFATARCACGWTGPGRRSRKRARDDGAEHLAEAHASSRSAG